MRVLICFVVCIAVTACATLDPNMIVDINTPKNSTSLLWCPRGNVDLASINNVKINEDAFGDRIYFNPGQTKVVGAVVEAGGSMYLAGAVMTTPSTTRYYDLNFVAKPNHTYLVDYKGPNCNAPLCIHDAGEGMNIPKQPAFSSDSFDKALNEALGSEIVATPTKR